VIFKVGSYVTGSNLVELLGVTNCFCGLQLSCLYLSLPTRTVICFNDPNQNDRPIIVTNFVNFLTFSHPINTFYLRHVFYGFSSCIYSNMNLTSYFYGISIT